MNHVFNLYVALHFVNTLCGFSNSFLTVGTDNFDKRFQSAVYLYE